MKIIEIRRKIHFERNQTQGKGEVITRTTKVKKYLLGIMPIKTLHEFSRKFHGELTACRDAHLFI